MPLEFCAVDLPVSDLLTENELGQRWILTQHMSTSVLTAIRDSDVRSRTPG